MGKANVSKLTNEELQAGRNEQKAHAEPSKKPANRASLYSTEYIKKLKLAEIEAFFDKFGVQACAKIPNEQDPKFVFVTCDDFQVVFSDYSFVFDFNTGLLNRDESTTPKFDMAAFKNYCDLVERTPEQVISEIMTVELFGQRFPSYAENRKRVKNEENRLAFETLPKSMRKSLKTANEQKENEIASTFNKLYYGDYAGDPYMMGSDENK